MAVFSASNTPIQLLRVTSCSLTGKSQTTSSAGSAVSLTDFWRRRRHLLRRRLPYRCARPPRWEGRRRRRPQPRCRGDLGIPCLGCDGKGVSGEEPVWDDTYLSCGAGDVSCTTTCCAGQAPDCCLLARCFPPVPSDARSPIPAADRVRPLVLVEIRPSVHANVVAPRRSWLTVSPC